MDRNFEKPYQDISNRETFLNFHRRLEKVKTEDKTGLEEKAFEILQKLVADKIMEKRSFVSEFAQITTLDGLYKFIDSHGIQIDVDLAYESLRQYLI